MGKKHKKHKSEKHGYEEYGDRPLKLVLKVSGNEVTAGSSSLDTFYDEQPADFDKPKDKKKKKKKDKEKSFGSPEEEKGKKKVTKKKKGQEADGDDDREQSRTPIRSEIDKQEEKEQTPLQEALNQLIRQLQRKDPNAFFSFPVTDLIAPGYSAVIKRPMDFSTMKDKVKKECYQSLDELKVDFRIMCENAMIYNKPETIYHKAARKLLHSGMKILSQERLDSLKQSIDFMAGLDPSAKQPLKSEEQTSTFLDQNKEGPATTDSSERSQTPSTPRQDKDSKDEAAKAEKELQEIRKVIEKSGGKLSNRVLQSDLEFARRKSDGSTTLAILNPADPSAGDVGYCPVKLGMMSNRLQSGVNTLQGFREDKRNRITPVSYMNYGPFTSYAPTYDSSFANISKEDSDLIYSLYGDESSLQGSDSLSEFLAKSEEYVYKLADNLLDAVTNGEHSRILKDTEQQVEQLSNIQEDKDTVEVADPQTCDRLDFLRSAAGLQMTEELSEEALNIQQKLDETTKLLRNLQEVQRERLSAKQPPNMICLLAPTAKELELAEKVTSNLAELTSQVAPCDVSSIYGIRKAMGIAAPPDPPELFIDLTTVQDTAEAMETSCPDVVPVIAV
ncbi:bromodomain-containing protein 7 [Pundamilia nyererei]|uniref:Bromodomain-containing protein 7 n=2 Tax=Haplochromini TaxID=319058 RepID=A0A9Y3VDC3_9CICH|nr:PREDICTED: bromodomain-containing protein 7 [Pundamilia nyererei]XP_026029708.1 bromodomain-containing protein 7 [Astatotilapia calliptera]